MVLYTPMAWEDVFPHGPEETPTFEQWIDGRLCLVRQGSNGGFQLERLLSTDPSDYMDPRFRPQTLFF